MLRVSVGESVVDDGALTLSNRSVYSCIHFAAG